MFTKEAMFRNVYVPLELKAEDVDDSGSFKGWGSTFGGKPDAHGDIIVEGAFKETILNGGRNGNGIAMLYQHDSKQPIGVWTSIEEVKKGLKIEGLLAMEVQQGRETHVLMKMGALKGLSIGYDFPKLSDGSRDPESFEIIDKGKGRTVRNLKKLDLWEISPVTFPANTRASITTVKDFEGCSTERELEDVLRESGLSRSAAQYIVSLCKPALRDSERLREEGGELKLDPEKDQLAILLLQGLRDRNKRLSDFL